jgi:cytochrome c oxidase assembly factor CtaG
MLLATPLAAMLGTQLARTSAMDLGATSFPVLSVVLLVGALALYLRWVQRFNRLTPRHRWPVARTAAFVGAIFTVALSLFSTIGYYDQALFWDHMVQHLLLIMVAAPLIAISSPATLLWRSSSGRARVRVKVVLRSPVAVFLGHPIVAFGLYAIVIPITHLTSFAEYMFEHDWISGLEHLLFLFVGYLFWRQIFGCEPNKFRLHPGLKFLLLFLAVPIDTFTGLSLDNATRELFPALGAAHQRWMPSLVQDLHLGGVIMWVGGDTLMLWPMIPVALEWMHLEERKAERADRDADAEIERLRLAAAEVTPTHDAESAHFN